MTWIRLDAETVVHVCDRGRSKKCASCGRRDGKMKLCDFPVEGGTCDAECCSRCAVHVGPDRDYCPKHDTKEAAVTDETEPMHLMVMESALMTSPRKTACGIDNPTSTTSTLERPAVTCKACLAALKPGDTVEVKTNKKKLKPDPVDDVAGKATIAICDALLVAKSAPAKKIDAQWMADTQATIKGCLLDDRKAVVTYYRDIVARLASQIGWPTDTCSSCGDPIWWVANKNGNRTPISRDGLNHFADCKHAALHRRPTVRK